MKFFNGPHMQWEVRVGQEGHSIIDHLESMLEPVPNFRLVAKLSDGGIVTRTLASPQTDRIIFGSRSENRIHFALTNYGAVSSPFQPICRCVLVSNNGSDCLQISAKPHQQSMVLFPFYALTAAALVAISIFCAIHSLWIQSLACVFIALALLGIPYLRMHQGFETDTAQLMDFLQEQGLKLETQSRSVAH